MLVVTGSILMLCVSVLILRYSSTRFASVTDVEDSETS